MEDFDWLVARMDGAMLIVTTTHAGEADGCLVGFHSQCGIDPPLYAVWLSVLNRTYRLGRHARALGIHVVDRRDHDLADLFGGTTGDKVDKLAACAWTAGQDGVPLLDRCPNRFVLQAPALLETDADHVCFVGTPVDAARSDRLEPLRLSDAVDITAGHPPDE
jgi:flavin reductase (DIM6/NTAB) family NADH-FMN oxidoreductase RutF